MMNRPGVKLRIALAAAVRREQPVRAHHAQDPGPGDADPVQDPQPRVHLPMALALERRPGEVGANGGQELLVRERGLWTSLGRALASRPALRPRPPSVERRSRVLSRPTHPLDSVPASGGRGGRAAHRRDLRIGKGRRRSAARVRSRNSSFSIDSSPMCRLAASSDTAAGSPA